ncbi:acyl-CoA carboxylase epsilon subunit [Streptomyces sp. NPDC091371]|uniref:acyl-CoA carboxylase epsilon subunit n=1 Tax=Streptomyces sp. NPDC091371 TaxID=3155303 RepID=UPI00341ECAE0
MTTPWKITGGHPSAEETAALTAVLTALLARRTAAAPAPAAGDRVPDSGWHRAHHNPHAAAGTWRGR